MQEQGCFNSGEIPLLYKLYPAAYIGYQPLLSGVPMLVGGADSLNYRHSFHAVVWDGYRVIDSSDKKRYRSLFHLNRMGHVHSHRNWKGRTKSAFDTTYFYAIALPSPRLKQNAKWVERQEQKRLDRAWPRSVQRRNPPIKHAPIDYWKGYGTITSKIARRKLHLEYLRERREEMAKEAKEM